MTSQLVNNIEVKKINRKRIYKLLYSEENGLTKQQIAQRLNMSQPTVLQNLKELQARGLVKDGGSSASIGGRRPTLICCNLTARFSVGIDITKHHLSVVVIGLGTNIIANTHVRLKFENTELYFQTVGRMVMQILKEYFIPEEQVLGVGISVPGLLSEDACCIEYAPILGFSGGTIESFSRFIPFPCIFINDASAAGMAEFWNLDNTDNMVYLSLSNSVGGAILLNRNFYGGVNHRSAEFGHMTIVHNGRPCYCGQKGCVDAYCNARILSDSTNGDLKRFFELESQGNPAACDLWNEYLSYLTITINNLRMAFDCTVILGGYVGSYLNPYIGRLREILRERNSFEYDGSYLKVCRYKTEASAVGAGLYYVEKFIDAI